MSHSHGILWDDTLIESEIRKTMKILNIDYFPTHSEIINLYGNRSLSCAISKHGGTEYWSKKLNIPIKKSETSYGGKYEKYAIKDILNHTGLVSTQTNTRHAYDLLVDGCVKVDVKASTINEGKSGKTRYYSFGLNKKEPTCDLFLFYGIDDNNSIRKTIIIPSASLVGQTQLGISIYDSVWDWYINKWELITEYDNFLTRYKVANKMKRRKSYE